MQRSIRKKILAVLAGSGIALGALIAAAPAGVAAQPVWYSGPTPYETKERRDSFVTVQLAQCVQDETWTQCQSYAPDQIGEGGRWWGGVTAIDLSANPGTEDGGKPDTNPIDLDPTPAPPPCWDTNNCPVGGAIQADVPQYMIAGAPQQLVVYAAWRPDASTNGAPTNGDAVISMDGEPVAAATFVDGKATFSFTPTEPGLKNVVISGVLNSNTSGANAWIDSVEGATMVVQYDPELFEEALKNKKVEVGDTYTLEEIAQAKTALGKRLEWRVAQGSEDVCAVTTTKKGEVRAKFTESGKCSIIWTDPKKDEEGKYTFKVTA